MGILSSVTSSLSSLRVLVRLVIVGFFLCAFSSEVLCQWNRINFPGFGNPKTPGGHLIYKSGIVWGGYDSLFRSLDSGMTWSVALSKENLHNRVIKSVYFLDAFNGIVSNGDSLYITNDGGLTWKTIAVVVNTQIVPGEAIFAGLTSVIIALGKEDMFTSTDGGLTFTRTYTAAGVTAIAYRNHGVVAVFQGARVIRSTDYGQTWDTPPFDQKLVDTYSIGFDVCDSTVLYIANEDYYYRYEKFSEVETTRDLGLSWKSSIRRGLDVFAGGLSTTANAAFFTTLDSGMYRTTDAGASWMQIPSDTSGPRFLVDTRWLAAINDNILLAVDRQGVLWRTNNCGGMPPPTRALPLLGELPLITIPQCASDSAQVLIISPNCKSFTIKNIRIKGPDSASLSAWSVTPLPVTLSRGASDTVKFKANVSNTNGLLEDLIVITWNDGAGDRDTAILVRLLITPAPIVVSIQEPIVRFDSLTHCDPDADTIVTITNLGCSDITLSKLTGTLAPNFSIDPLSLPLTIHPDSSVNIHVRFSPISGGSFKTSAVLTFRSGELDHTDTLRLFGSSANGRGKLTKYDSLLNFGKLNFCFAGVYRDTSATIKNVGCDTLWITSGPGPLAAGFTTGTLQLPIAIPPDSILVIPVRFEPPAIGTYGGQLVFEGDTRDKKELITIRLLGVAILQKAGPIAADSAIDFGIVASCHSARDTMLVLANHGCDTLCITAGVFAGLGVAYSVSTLSLPICLAPDSVITMQLSFRPPTTGSYLGKLDLLTVRENKPQQFSFTLTGTSSDDVVGPTVLDPLIRFDTVSFCDIGQEKPIFLKNRSCDTLELLSGPLTLPNGFSLDPMSYPVILPPDSECIAIVHYKPIVKGDVQTPLQFVTKRRSITSTVDLTLSGTATNGTSVFSLVTNELKFPALPFCDRDSAEIAYTNIGCDTLYVTPQGLSGDPDFTSSVTGEHPVAPGDTIRVTVLLTPIQKGLRRSIYSLHVKNASTDSSDVPVLIEADIRDATKQLQSSTAAIDFPARSICNSDFDTILSLSNSGCDTLWIFGFGTTGEGFDMNPQPPFFILPKEKKDIHVTGSVFTYDHRTTNTGSLTLVSNSDLPLAPITLSQSYIYPKGYPLRLELPITYGGTSDTISIRLVADTLPPRLLEIDLTLMIGDTDLLTFVRHESPNMVTINGDKLIISGSPIVHDNGLIAELFYKVYLTGDSTSSIDLRDVTFNPADSSYERCIASAEPAAASDFHYVFHCGERMILSLLRGEQNIRLLSIHPNPTEGEVTADLSVTAATEVPISIVDALGKVVYSRTQQFQSGTQHFRFDLNSVASGIYHLRIGSIEASFIKSN